MKTNLENIGQRVKKVRKVLKKAQQALADELNITKQAISNIENGKSAPSLTLLSKLLIDYNVNMNYIVCGIGSMFNINNQSEKTLKNSIILEVEKLLSERGIE